MPDRSVTYFDFDETLESCRRFLLAVANEELPSDLRAKGGASDLVQQTLAAAIRSEHQFRGQSVGELRAWLRAILRTEVAAFRRRYSGTAARDVGRETSLLEAVAADFQTPIRAAIQVERNQQMADAVGQLPDEYRRAVILRLEDSLSFAEIGRRLGRSEEAARKLFTRALDRLRSPLAALADDK
jgi:RNA polymerase sigma-70 factor (ECF subfamily)